jgi:hypothetical protein
MVTPHGMRTIRGGSSGFFEVVARVNTTTSSYVVLVEFGRFPLEIFWWQQTMRFLSRVSSEVDSDRMLRLAYDVQLQLLTTRQKVLFGNKVLWVERADCLLAG